LSESPVIPLDVFEKAQVIREEHNCVPAFYFDYDAEANYNYQRGQLETRQERGFTSDGGEVIKTIEETKWYPERGVAAESGSVFFSANKEMSTYINRLYGKININDLTDYDYLKYPGDVKTFEFDLPEGTVFNEHVKPVADSQLEKDAVDQISNQKYAKELNVSGCKFVRKEIKRVFLGLYRVVYNYGGKEFFVWVTGDGKRFIHEGIPEDPKRKAAIEDKKKEKAAVPRKTGLLTFGMVIGILSTIIGGIAVANGPYDVGEWLISLAFLVPGLAIAILCGIKRSKIVQIYNAKCAKIQDEIDAIVVQATNVVQKFKSQKKALTGIYEGVSDDSSAF
jgi:hypothetical protein